MRKISKCVIFALVLVASLLLMSSWATSQEAIPESSSDVLKKVPSGNAVESMQTESIDDENNKRYADLNLEYNITDENGKTHDTENAEIYTTESVNVSGEAETGKKRDNSQTNEHGVDDENDNRDEKENAGDNNEGEDDNDDDDNDADYEDEDDDSDEYDHSEEVDEEEDELLDENGNVINKVKATVHTIFPNASSPIYPTFPAGTTAHALIAYQNNEDGVNHTIALALGFLQPAHNLDVIIQNFSVVRHGRIIYPHETANIRYSFTPDEYFEPGEYNLVIGVFVNNELTNETTLITAFNSTILIEDAIGTDARTILTYFTMLIIVIGITYLVARRFGLDKKIYHLRQNGLFATVLGRNATKNSSGHINVNKQSMEAGTLGESYDPEFVSAEHLRYRDKILNRSASNSHKSTSPHPQSPKKNQEQNKYNKGK